MGRGVNKIRNPDFSSGKSIPAGWTWKSHSTRCRWVRMPEGGVCIEAPGGSGSAGWSQPVVCRPGQFYRVEAEVLCDLTAADERSGFVVEVEPLATAETRKKVKRGGVSGPKWVPAGRPSVTPSVHRASQPVVVRAYYEVPDGVRRMLVRVGIADGAGWARILAVRVMHILEPDEVSHPLAIPPPPVSLPAGCTAGRVAVVTRDTSRKLVRLLGAVVGERRVSATEAASFAWDRTDDKAVLFPDEVLPPSIGSLSALFAACRQRTVIVSLPAFAKLAGASLVLRHVEQPDDPMHAKVSFANEYTRGFALADVFPCAAQGRRPGTFAQNHFRNTPAQKAFFKKHGIVSMLLSMGAHDATSDRPLCLFRRFDSGALFVFDLNQVETPSSTGNESLMSMYFLLNLLGRHQTHLGQFASPFRREAGFRESIREMGRRFAPFVVHDEDVPVERVREQLVTIGRDESAFGPPSRTRPVILVRSGLVSGDMESIHGAWAWFKQLVRPEPHACGYADRLASRFRPAWVPCAAPWEWNDGFLRSGRLPESEIQVECEPGQIAALIDIVSLPVHRARVVLPGTEGDYRRYLHWLPMLWRGFPSGAAVTFAPPDGEGFCDRDRWSWREGVAVAPPAIKPDRFRGEVFESVVRAGGMVLRIEVPGWDSDFTCDSIRRTDVTATLLEHVVGLQYGLIAVNRRPVPVLFDGFPPVIPGKVLVVERDDPQLAVHSHAAG